MDGWNVPLLSLKLLEIFSVPMMRCILPMAHQRIGCYFIGTNHAIGTYQWTSRMHPYSAIGSTLSPNKEMHFTNGILIKCY